jgi:hypothetical protein
MNTQPQLDSDLTAVSPDFTWMDEKEHDLASWLDELDLDLHEQLVCGTEQEARTGADRCSQ